MKKILVALALATGILGGAPRAQAQNTNELLQLAVSVLSQQFGMSSNNILSASQTYGEPVYDMVPAYAIEHRVHVPMDRIMRLRRAGLSWPQVAARLGLSQAQIRELVAEGYMDPNQYWATVAHRRYGVPAAQFRAVRLAGADWDQAWISTHIARQYRIQPVYVYRSYRTNRNWTRIVLPTRRVIVVVPARSSILYRVLPPRRVVTIRPPVRRIVVRPRADHRAQPLRPPVRRVQIKHNKPVYHQRTVTTNGNRRVTTSVVRNPAQTIRKRTVWRGGKVVSKTMTHVRNPRPHDRKGGGGPNHHKHP